MIKMNITNRGKMLRRLKRRILIDRLKEIKTAMKSDQIVKLAYEKRKGR